MVIQNRVARLLLLFLNFLLACGITQANNTPESTIDTADLQASVREGGRQFLLTAQSLKVANCTSVGCKRWITRGYPRIVVQRDRKGKPIVFFLSRTAFSFDVEFFTDSDAAALAAAASAHPSQIEMTPIQDVVCRIEFETNSESRFDSVQNTDENEDESQLENENPGQSGIDPVQRVSLTGSAKDLTASPIRVSFSLQNDDVTRPLVESELRQWTESDVIDEFVVVRCDVAFAKTPANVVFSQVDSVDLDSQLLQQRDTSTFVTRWQLENLGNSLLRDYNSAADDQLDETSVFDTLRRDLRESGKLGPEEWLPINRQLPPFSRYGAAELRYSSDRDSDSDSDSNDDDDDGDDSDGDPVSLLERFFVFRGLGRVRKSKTICMNQSFIDHLRNLRIFEPETAVFSNMISLGKQIAIVEETCRRELEPAEQLGFMNNDSTSDLRWEQLGSRIIPVKLRVSRYFASSSRPLKLAARRERPVGDSLSIVSYALHARKQYAMADRNTRELTTRLIHLSDKLASLADSASRLNQSLDAIERMQNSSILNSAFIRQSSSHCRDNQSRVSSAASAESCAATCYIDDACAGFQFQQRISSCIKLISIADTPIASPASNNCVTYHKISGRANWQTSVLNQLSSAQATAQQLNDQALRLTNAYVNSSLRCVSCLNSGLKNLTTTHECSSSQQVTRGHSVNTIGTTSRPSTDFTCARPPCRDNDFLFVSDFLTWSNALIHCRNHGMQLVAIKTAEKQNRITQYLVSNHPSAEIWIGLETYPDNQHDSSSEVRIGSTFHQRSRAQTSALDIFMERLVGQMFPTAPPQKQFHHRWIDGQPSLYLNWVPDRPSAQGHKCVVISPVYGFKWLEVSCSLPRQFLCERSTSSSNAVVHEPRPSIASASCPSRDPAQSVLVASTVSAGTLIKIYQKIALRYSYLEAKQLCESVGYKLGQISSAEVWNGMRYLILSNRLRSVFYLGFERMRDGQWRWYANQNIIHTNVYSGPFSWKNYGHEAEPRSGNSYGLLRVDHDDIALATIHSGWQCSTLLASDRCYYICTC